MTASSIPQAPQSIPQVVTPNMTNEDYLLKKNLHNSVLVPVMENLTASVGVGVGTIALFVIASSLGAQVNWLGTLKISVAAALLVAGWSTAVRFSRDEWRMMWQARNVRALDKDRQNLVNELRTATGRIQTLEQELSVSGRYSSLAMAEQLLREHFFENKPMNRDTAMARGWTRPNWTLAYKHLQNAGVVDGRGQFKDDAINYEAAMGKALMATHGAGRYVRAKDGSMIKVDSYEKDAAIDEVEELPTVEVSSRSNREVKQYPRPTPAYVNQAQPSLAQSIGLGYDDYNTSDNGSQVRKVVYKG